MKIRLSKWFILRKTHLLLLFMCTMNTLLYAQKVYVSSQNNQIYGPCGGCSVDNPQNIVGPDESNYTSMIIPLGLGARIEQTLIFPSVKTHTKVAIGIGTNISGLSVQLLAGVSIETFNGNTSNNDYRIVNNEMLKIGLTGINSSKGTIEFITTKPYDRVRISLNAGLLNLNGGLNLYYAYQLDNRVYASSETHIAYSESCNNCSVQNPQNAVGPNENDHSTLTISTYGNVRNIQQTLFFPTTRTFTKLVIGVGSDNKPISQIIKDRTFIRTITEDDGTAEPIVDQLKVDPQNPNRGIIECITSLPYKGVRFWLHGINESNTGYYVDDLKIYYAYQEELSLDACKNVPYDPFYYFSFNGNTNSTKFGFNLHPSILFPEFKNNIACQQGLTSTTSPYALESPDIPQSLYTGDITVAFWANIRPGDPLIPDPNDPGEYLPPTKPQPYLKLEAFGEKFHMDSKHLMIGEEFDGGQISQPGGYAHYVLVLKANGDIDNACIYVNGQLGGDSIDENGACTLWTQEKRINHKKIKIALDRADIDELIIYNKALNESEIRLLYHSYNISQNNASIISTSLSNKTQPITLPEKDILTLSPNPTTGNITFSGNISLEGAEIFVSDTFGTEVFRTKVKSKILELPQRLPGGVYILTLQTKDKKIFTRKVFLTR
ncbi:T9SS C-terminal target domain-containing protein [Chryseobacterium phosphatilyticum]|uniref:T9SS C-terminal target domain-containing protein n=1 Tax=Chryseobacterium phosphatilyticum TaxID=475075 RepID=A0A316X6G3_9FLAO|nr:T9SS type A sorting domain-containing protein [Chryseobacterium phosphatilyticum]PWN66868.1 T9SS C-terminal target domain-containing protein [Chryseobacterium phosphatilyticum]